MPTRDHILLWINGERHEVCGDDAFLSLSDFLRARLRLVGTKIVCSEGDCGACSVLVGRPDGDRLDYKVIDACIAFMFQLDGTHVVTVEGLADDALTPIQQAMVDCHGSQCGFCTPGFVVTMHGHCEVHGASDEQSWRQALTGNLCRCTGYSPILAAAEQAGGCTTVAERYAAAPLLDSLREDASGGVALVGEGRCAFCATSVGDAVRYLADHPDTKIVAGATDVGVQLNKRVIAPSDFLVIHRIAEMQGVAVDKNGAGRILTAGACATWADLEETVADKLPQFSDILSRFGSPQIRHMGTIGGNLINASPIADSVPLLYVLDAQLELASTNGTRRVNINEFYTGYKQFDLAPGELLTRVVIPLPDKEEKLRLYKVSRRRDLDISTFTAAIRLQLNGDTITDAKIAYGAVGPTIVRLTKTEDFLVDQPFSEETMHAAGDIAVAKITPISDVRGSAEYRRQLARNVLVKFYHEEQVNELALA